MKQKIKGYHLDSETHWVAELECGHTQHVRHDPPWTVREWVTTEEGRASRIGQELGCVLCDDTGTRVAKTVLTESKKRLIQAYHEAGISGLCDEGRIEYAVAALDSMEIQKLIESALKN